MSFMLYSLAGIRSMSMAHGSRIPLMVSLDGTNAPRYAASDIKVEHGPRIVVVKHLLGRPKNFFR